VALVPTRCNTDANMDQIIALILTYKYPLILPISVIEGPIITILCGFLSAQGQLNFLIAYGILIVGDLIGDSLLYSIGRFGRVGFVERWGRHVGITKEKIKNLETHFENHSGKTIISAKLSHVLVMPVLVAAGTAKMHFWKFLFFNLIPTIPKSLTLMLIGFFFGHAFNVLKTYVDSIELVGIIIVVTIIVVYILYAKLTQKISKKVN
jgi:membrane-associated protein